MPRLDAVRYVTPLREGGSLPAIIDTEPPGQYVIKFRGAGQGPRALVAELLAAGLAQALDLPVPAPAVIRVDEAFGRSEPDPEIQDLLRWSEGLNFGLEYLPAALGFDIAVDLPEVDSDLAASIVWFDALISNVDRTPRNPNLLLQHGKMWLIDHGASFYFHHAPGNWVDKAQSRFPQIKDHILLLHATDITAADARLRSVLTPETLRDVIHDLPDDWLDAPEAERRAYVDYLEARLNGPREWLEEAENARRQLG